MPELAEGDPEGLGFSASRLKRVRDLLKSFVGKAFPGAVLLVARRGRIVLHEAVGLAEIEPCRRTVSRDTLFDLASLTKPLATSLIVGRLVAEGVLHLRQRVVEILPEFRNTVTGPSSYKERVELWMLLSHSSGLPPWLPLYRYATTREGVMAEALRAFPSYEPGRQAIYSDLGFVVLTAVVERAAGERLDRLFSSLVAKPLGLKRTVFNPLRHGFSRSEIAATEVVDGEPLVGVVHDENARAMDGVSGHAGLFSTAYEVGLLAQGLLEAYRGVSDDVLPPRYVRTMWRAWSTGDRSYGLGWWVYDGRQSAAGDLATPGRCFGHTGFTGTSLWVDTELDLVVVLLTNRVHPSRGNREIARARPLIHNAVFSSVKRV